MTSCRNNADYLTIPTPWKAKEHGPILLQSKKPMPLDNLVELIDIKNQRWDLYRTESKEWVVQLENDGQKEYFSSNSLPDVLTLASSFTPTPTTPPKPREFFLSDFTAKKDGSSWTLYEKDKPFQFNFKTKKSAMELAQKVVELTQVHIQEWERNHES